MKRCGRQPFGPRPRHTSSEMRGTWPPTVCPSPTTESSECDCCACVQIHHISIHLSATNGLLSIEGDVLRVAEEDGEDARLLHGEDVRQCWHRVDVEHAGVLARDEEPVRRLDDARVDEAARAALLACN